MRPILGLTEGQLDKLKEDGPARSAVLRELRSHVIARLKEMEAAAVAWVCQSLGAPFVALKAITDIVDGEAATRAEFESNLHTASAALQKKLALMLSLLSNTRLGEWATGSGYGTSSGTASAEPERPPSTKNHDEGAHAITPGSGSSLPSAAIVVSLSVATGLILGAMLGRAAAAGGKR